MKYERPKQLSDPYSDFDNEEDQEELRRILTVKDEDMGFKEFACIFQGVIPAGTYEECAYFVPVFLRFFRNNRDTVAAEKCELISALDYMMEWSNCYYCDLKRDGFWRRIIYAMESTFSYLTREHIDEPDGYPAGAGTVFELLYCAATLKHFYFLMKRFQNELLNRQDEAGKKWVATIKRSHLWYDQDRSPIKIPIRKS